MPDITDTVTIARAEYDELKKAKFAIVMLGKSLNRYGVDDRIAVPLLKQFGYTPPEEEDDA